MSGQRFLNSGKILTALRERNMEKAETLLRTSGFTTGKDGHNLLCAAVEKKHTAVVELLIKKGAKVNSQNRKLTKTLLHLAVLNSNISIIKMLLEAGADVHARNEFNRTPLHYAIFTGRIKICELLLKYKADPNAKDNEGIYALNAAAEKNCLSMVELLLNYGAVINCSGSWRNCFTPLHFAVVNGNPPMISLMLSKGANANVFDDNETPLHLAVKKEYLLIAEELINHGAKVNAVTVKEGYTPLHYVSLFSDASSVVSFLSLLINRGAAIDAKSKDKLTPLHLSCQKGHEAAAHQFLERGAKVDEQTIDGRTVLDCAVEGGSLAIVKEVLKYGPDVNNEGNKSCIKKAMYSRGAEYKAIIAALLQYGLTISASDAKSAEILHHAVDIGYITLIEHLLKYGANVDIVNNGMTSLNLAAKNNQDQIVSSLINFGADINIEDEAGHTPIYYAVINNNVDLALLFVDIGAKVKEYPELLRIAIKKENVKLVKSLLQCGVDVNSCDKYGQSPLHLSIFCQVFYINPNIYIKFQLVILLLSNGANVDAVDSSCKTPLSTAAKLGYVNIVEALLEYNANVNFKGRDGVMPLHLAAQSKQIEIVKMLLGKGAKINAKQDNGNTALHVASHVGATNIVRELLINGAAINECNETQSTALHMAAKAGNEGVVKVLLEFDADVNIVNSNNETCLDCVLMGIPPEYLNYAGLEHDILDGFFHDDDDDDDDIEFYAQACRFHDTALPLISYIVKMKLSKSHVCENIMNVMKGRKNIAAFYLKLEEEIEAMRKEKINASVSFFDVLMKNINVLARYTSKDDLSRVFGSDDELTIYNKLCSKFNEYGHEIERKLYKVAERKALLEDSDLIFPLVFDNLLEDCIDVIVSYLRNEDLKVLKKIFEREESVGIISG